MFFKIQQSFGPKLKDMYKVYTKALYICIFCLLCFSGHVNAFPCSNTAQYIRERKVPEHISIKYHYHKSHPSRPLNRWPPLELSSPQRPILSPSYRMLTINTLLVTSLRKTRSECECVRMRGGCS